MQLDSLVMDREEAAERLVEYEKALRHERNAEDEAVAAGYRAAARGLPVISLSEAMTAGGWFDNGLPRMAICRADAVQCWVRVQTWRDGRTEFASSQTHRDRGALVGQRSVRVTIAYRPALVAGHGQRAGSTVVPSVPPRHRPKRGRLGLFHVLWEVEEWSPVPPQDPALLRHIRGDLWAVMAIWDLTPLERAVLAQRSS